MRVQSETPRTFKSGDVGFFHRLGESKHHVPYKKQERAPEIDAEAIIGRWRDGTLPGQFIQYAQELGIEPSNLIEMHVAWSREHGAWGWPMRNGHGKVVGIRLRWKDAKKRCVTGSHNALFWPYCAPEKMVFIVEGGTDVAAALKLRLFSIGRPSCNGGLEDLKIAIRRLGVHRAVIVADNDEDKLRPDGSKYNPGIDGGQSLSRHLEVPCCVVTLPFKDLRQAVAAGMNSEDIESLVRSTVWTMPTQNYERTRQTA
jgi:hypothetical protein